jgi:hypothetical protein
MSALGQKQTLHSEIAMSAIHPKADIKLASSMSAKCQRATFRERPLLLGQRVGTEMLVSAGCAAVPLRYANKVPTKPQAAANISHSPATARLSVAWIK